MPHIIFFTCQSHFHRYSWLFKPAAWISFNYILSPLRLWKTCCCCCCAGRVTGVILFPLFQIQSPHLDRRPTAVSPTQYLARLASVSEYSRVLRFRAANWRWWLAYSSYPGWRDSRRSVGLNLWSEWRSLARSNRHYRGKSFLCFSGAAARAERPLLRWSRDLSQSGRVAARYCSSVDFFWATIAFAQRWVSPKAREFEGPYNWRRATGHCSSLLRWSCSSICGGDCWSAPGVWAYSSISRVLAGRGDVSERHTNLSVSWIGRLSAHWPWRCGDLLSPLSLPSDQWCCAACQGRRVRPTTSAGVSHSASNCTL